MTTTAPITTTATVLLVDDTDANRQLLGYWLRHNGFEVLEAGTGVAALEQMARTRPDLVVLDTRLPDLSGLEVCRRIKTDPTTSAIPVLQMSAAATESSDRVEALEHGADAYLVMPMPPLEFLAIVRSLLRMRRAEEQSVLEAERWSAAFDASIHGMALLDPSGVFLRVNKTFCSMLRQPVDGLRGRHWREVTHPDDVAENERRVTAALDGALDSDTLEKRYLTRDGEAVWATTTFTIVRDRTGTPVQVVVQIQDLTERRRAEAQLASAREEAEAARRAVDQERADIRFRALLDAAPDGIVVVDAAGVIRLVNRQVEKLFGYDRRELLDQPLEMLLPSEHRDVHVGHRRRYVEDPSARRMGVGLELMAQRKNGSVFPVDVKLSPLQTDDGLLVSASVRDVTDRKHAEAERQQLEARLYLAQRLESLGQLAGGVAHDFNNLLAVILNYAGFVAEELSPGTQAAGDLDQIRLAAERAAALTHQLLVFGRREVVKPEVVELNDVIRDLQPMVERTIGEHIRVETNLADDLESVMIDRSGCDQVLMNLLVNARDALRDGGVVIVQTENIELAGDEQHPALPAGRYVRLTVADNGSGMDTETAARAFEPFFTTKPRGEGTGLGLATVYGVVTQAGGAAHLYSEPGKGTAARVYLPVSAASPGTAEPAPVAHAPVAGATILVVEDEDGVRHLSERILRRSGYRVLTAANGAEALVLCEETEDPIDLVLTDVVMPVMSGRELVERLSGVRPGIRALFMSGYPQGIIDRGDQGDADLLEKPFTAADLVQRVASVLGDEVR